MLCLHGGLTRSEDVSELKLKQMLFHFNSFSVLFVSLQCFVRPDLSRCFRKTFLEKICKRITQLKSH